MALAEQPGAGVRKPKKVYYPTRDGEHMGETDLHRDVTYDLIAALKLYYTDRPNVYISGDNFLYYVEGDPKRVISPDTYVVFGVQMRRRDIYKVWEEGGHLPAVVFEVTSKKTKDEDTGRKFFLYENVLRTPEYFQFDPTGDYLPKQLRGYRLDRDRYVELEPDQGRLRSEQLGLDLVVENDYLRLYDPVRNYLLPSYVEQTRAVQEQTERADAAELQVRIETERATSAEAEIARLRAELEALRKQTES